MNKKVLIILLTFCCASACNKIPSDPEKSYERALSDGLKVGYVDNSPWIYEKNNEISGIESNLIKSFAEENNMKIILTKGSEQELFKKLEKGELDVVMCGLLKNTPWKTEKIGLSMPYYKAKKEKRVIAVRQGENRLLQKIEKLIYEKKSMIYKEVDAALQKL